MKSSLTFAGMALALVAIALFVWWQLVPRAQTPTGWNTYENAAFSILYPQGFTVDEAYTYQGLGPGVEIPGISFTIPASITEGTNLSEDSSLSVASVEGECNASRFILDGTSSTIVDKGVNYSFATTSDAGAGNRYEEIVYALSDSVPCVLIRYFIHSTAVENYDPGTIIAFDRTALVQQFDAIRRSLVVKE